MRWFLHPKNGLRLKLGFQGSLALVVFAVTSEMPSSSLAWSDTPPFFSHKVRDGHGESAFLPRDVGTSISTSGSDVGQPVERQSEIV